MNIVPTPVAQYVNRVPEQYRMYSGIGFAILAGSCALRLIFLVFDAIAFASYGLSPVSLIFGFVLWGVIGVAAAIISVAFFTGTGRPN